MGLSPGLQRTKIQSPTALGRRPYLSASTSPGAIKDDLPHPEGPVTKTVLLVSSRLSSSSIWVALPKKIEPSSSLNGRSPGYGSCSSVAIVLALLRHLDKFPDASVQPCMQVLELTVRVAQDGGFVIAAPVKYLQ